MAPKQRQNKENIEGAEQRKGYGKVPKYLQKFNKEKEDKQKQKEMDAELAKCPPGTRKMPQEERLAMLEDLKSTKT